MPKRHRGTVRGGVVVLEPDANLREGAEVEVIEYEIPFQPNWDAAWRTVGIARDREGRTDVSERADEYLLQTLQLQEKP
jgi:hypothetical protein